MLTLWLKLSSPFLLYVFSLSLHLVSERADFEVFLELDVFIHIFLIEALVGWFLHPSHRQRSEHLTPDWKHSQYFLMQPLFLQLHPLVWTLPSVSSDLLAELPDTYSILGLKASGFLARCSLMACSRAFDPVLLPQFWQLQSRQPTPYLKQSQYSFKHLECLQLHFALWLKGIVASLAIRRAYSASIVDSDFPFCQDVYSEWVMVADFLIVFLLTTGV